MVAEARRRRLLSADHFTVDGTLLEAWASLKSYRPRDDQEPPSAGGRNPEVDFRGQQRRSDTHASTTDPEARLYRKGRGQKAALSYMGHLLTENRHGLVVDVELTEAHGRAEREAAASRAAGRDERARDHGAPRGISRSAGLSARSSPGPAWRKAPSRVCGVRRRTLRIQRALLGRPCADGTLREANYRARPAEIDGRIGASTTHWARTLGGRGGPLRRHTGALG